MSFIFFFFYIHNAEKTKCGAIGNDNVKDYIVSSCTIRNEKKADFYGEKRNLWPKEEANIVSEQGRKI